MSEATAPRNYRDGLKVDPSLNEFYPLLDNEQLIKALDEQHKVHLVDGHPIIIEIMLSLIDSYKNHNLSSLAFWDGVGIALGYLSHRFDLMGDKTGWQNQLIIAIQRGGQIGIGVALNEALKPVEQKE